DFATTTWRELPHPGDAPAARSCGALGFVAGAVVATGGHGVAFVQDDTWRYDLTAERWSRVATDGSTAAAAHWAYTVDTACDPLIVAGGDHNDHSDPAPADPLAGARFTGLAASALPDASDHATLVLAGRELILYGGTLGDGGSYLDGTWRYTVPPCR